LSIRGPTAEALAENAFKVAIDADHVRIVKKIMELGIDLNEQIYRTRYGVKLTPLQRACQMNSLELVRVYVEAGVDVNSTLYKGCSTLTFAIDSINRNGPVDTEVVQILLRTGANVNPGYCNSPLASAARSGTSQLSLSLSLQVPMSISQTIAVLLRSLKL
jgi:Ankyrin repeat